MNKKKLMLSGISIIIILIVIFLLVSYKWLSNKWLSNNNIPLDNAFINSTSDFELINAYNNATNLNILYSKTFSGNISYIVSKTNLNISTESEFNASTALKTTVAIKADGLRYNDYINITNLSSRTTYYVYIFDTTSSKVKSFVKKTNSIPAMTTKTGTLSDGTLSYTYTLYFPAQYGLTPSKKWPLLVSLNTNHFKSSNFNLPCIVFCIEAQRSNRSRYYSFYHKIQTTLKNIINDDTYHIDKNKLYTAGYSVGGCWAMDLANDSGSSDYKFKAAVGIGIGWWFGETIYYKNLGNLNIWLFYGENDKTWGKKGTKVAYQTIPRTIGDHFLTEMPGLDHVSCQIPVWQSPYTFIWLFSK
jgi:hypothetical protein